ncbi:hypothetical protein RHMOL_Rhmol04G0097900 [Rhododendron molle]|uniref:Uncharacterized protein n=1 Tax=Rhododendron molle TaxID=49168 RepID=A0ACC0P175_RHOML|nr:hypothetical protein RHMOL_Rhmol04G0097900 [Rhododendron molle]
MAAFELLLSQARRHCFPKPTSQLSLLLRSTSTSPFLHSHRSLSSSSSPPDPTPQPANPPNDEQQPTSTKPQPPSIQPVSYAIKPKDPSPPPQNPPQSAPPPPRPETRAWTREDIRYVKDVPNVSPISYPTRVAPLPEDRVAEEGGEVGEEKKGVDEELAKEVSRIQEESRRVSRWGGGLRGVEEERVAFPRIIKQDQKNKKVIYDLQEAIRLVKANAKTSFNETVEVHVNLAAELRRTDLKLDGVATLPHGTGKDVKVAVFAEGSAADEARAAGAAIVGGVELVEGIKSGTVKADFDICITTHQFVQRLQKLGNVLKSRMPSTKAGTVTDDVGKAVRDAKRIVKLNKKDKAAVVHAGVGKVSFSEEALRENIGAFVNALLLAKPPGLKKSSKYAGYMNAVHICSTMGPGFPVSIQSLSIAADRYTRLQLN